MKTLRLIVTTFSLAGMMLLLSSCSAKHTPLGSLTSKNDSSKSIDSSSQAAPLNPHMTLTYEQRQGKYLYTKYCAVCHGEDGKGDGFNAFNLDPKPRDFTDGGYMNALTDERIEQTISGGGRSVNKSVLMQSWGGRLKKEEIRYVLSYIRKFNSSK